MEWIDSQLPTPHEPIPVSQLGKPGYVPQPVKGDTKPGHWLSPAMAIWVKSEEIQDRIPSSARGDEPEQQR